MSLEAASTETPAAEAASDTTLATGATPIVDATEAPADATLLTAQPEAEGDAPEADGDAGETKGEPEGAPEEYAEFDVPEGVVLDQEVLAEFLADAKERGLTQAEAQREVERGVKILQKAQDSLSQQILETRQAWVDATKADKQLGGDALDANLATARRALDAYGSPELTQLLNETGLGNHPEVIRLLVKAGGAVAEDTFVAGGTATNAKTAAAILYPNHPSKE